MGTFKSYRGSKMCSSCPVCMKDFREADIEEHVNKCIFLHTETEKTENKRFSDQFANPRSKRQKNTSSPATSGDDSKPGVNDVGKKEPVNPSESSTPLAERMRPCELSNFVGQRHVLGPSKVLRALLEKGDIPNMILWGPPGCGKTSLAHIISQQCKKNNQKYRFVKLSATMDGIDKVKECVKIARNELSSFKRCTLLFVDEIHRFNKLQQDVFLPHVESGVVTLIGATTENPSFSLNNALLSRCQVFVLEKLLTEDVEQIVKRALKTVGIAVAKAGQTDVPVRGNSPLPWAVIDEAIVRWLAEMCDGDARIALNSTQLAQQLLQQKKDADSTAEIQTLSLEDIKDCVKRSHILYDKKGDEHYNIISALHKSIRASDDNAALYWLARMLQGGEDPMFIARRLVRTSSQYIGLADPMALSMAVSAMQGCQLLGMPECDVLLAQCAVYLARAPKSREIEESLARAKSFVAEHKGPQPTVPLHLRKAPTQLMKSLGYAKGYNMEHKDVSGLQYMPEGLEQVHFF